MLVWWNIFTRASQRFYLQIVVSFPSLILHKSTCSRHAPHPGPPAPSSYQPTQNSSHRNEVEELLRSTSVCMLSWGLLAEVSESVPWWPPALLLLVVWFLCFCRTPVGRGRAWLRLALMQKKLSEYMKALINKKELLRYEHLVKLCSSLAMFYIVWGWIIEICHFCRSKTVDSWQFHVVQLVPSPTRHTHILKNRCLFVTCLVCRCGIYTGQAKTYQPPSPAKNRKGFWHLSMYSDSVRQEVGM